MVPLILFLDVPEVKNRFPVPPIFLCLIYGSTLAPVLFAWQSQSHCILSVRLPKQCLYVLKAGSYIRVPSPTTIMRFLAVCWGQGYSDPGPFSRLQLIIFLCTRMISLFVKCACGSEERRSWVVLSFFGGGGLFFCAFSPSRLSVPSQALNGATPPAAFLPARQRSLARLPSVPVKRFQ